MNPVLAEFLFNLLMAFYMRYAVLPLFTFLWNRPSLFVGVIGLFLVLDAAGHALKAPSLNFRIAERRNNPGAGCLRFPMMVLRMILQVILLIVGLSATGAEQETAAWYQVLLIGGILLVIAKEIWIAWMPAAHAADADREQRGDALITAALLIVTSVTALMNTWSAHNRINVHEGSLASQVQFMIVMAVVFLGYYLPFRSIQYREMIALGSSSQKWWGAIFLLLQTINFVSTFYG